MRQRLTMEQFLRSEEDIEGVLENNREELLEQFIEEKGLVRGLDLDDICVVCGVYVAEGSHVCNSCRRGAYEE